MTVFTFEVATDLRRNPFGVPMEYRVKDEGHRLVAWMRRSRKTRRSKWVISVSLANDWSSYPIPEVRANITDLLDACESFQWPEATP